MAFSPRQFGNATHKPASMTSTSPKDLHADGKKETNHDANKMKINAKVTESVKPFSRYKVFRFLLFLLVLLVHPKMGKPD